MRISSAVTMPEACIWPVVKVPVLSVKSTEAEPKVSAAGSFLTSAPALSILSIPRAKITVTATGRPSGTVATPTATVRNKISVMGKPRRRPIIKINKIPPRTICPMALETCLMPSWKGVGVSSPSLTSEAIFPSSVFSPVVVTATSAQPSAASVPAQTRLLRSKKCIFFSKMPGFFSTGIHSPLLAVYVDRGVFLQRSPDFFKSSRSPAFLDYADCCVYKNRDENYERVGIFIEKNRNYPREDKREDQRAFELGDNKFKKS